MAEEEKKTKEEKKHDPVSTLRGVRRMAKGGVQNWTGSKVRTKSGYMVTARINNGVVETLFSGNKWIEYPKKGKNLDPGWSPTPPQ